MSIFTEYPIAAPTEVYSSTNRYARYAIAFAEKTLGPFLASPYAQYHAMTGQLNSLPSLDWLQLDYAPMLQVVRLWIAEFFTHRSKKGLYPLEQQWVPCKIWDPKSSSWVYDLNPSDNDSRLMGPSSTRDCSYIGMLGRMRDFLDWDSGDLHVVKNCRDWATAFLNVNAGTNLYGHLRGATDWRLYNFVHVGPPMNAVASPADDFQSQLRWALEGLPDSSWAQTGQYGLVASAFERLTGASGDLTYATKARDITEGLWKARLAQDKYFVCDTVTPWGLIPGDYDLQELKYEYDTDSLYWTNALYEAYGAAAGKWLPGLEPHPNPKGVATMTSIRLSLVTALLANAGQNYPTRYLAIALATTLEWIRWGWLTDPGKNHFVRKIHHDGTLPTPHQLYGDAVYNTLRMLVNAYRYTRDGFYLDLFELMLDQLRKVTYTVKDEVLEPAPPNLDLNKMYFFHGLFPEAISDGALVEPLESRRSQDIALDLVVRAFAASQEALAPRPSLLQAAEEMAQRIIELDNQGYGPVVYSVQNGVLQNAMVNLARRPGTLRRIGFDLQTTGRTLTFDGVGIQSLVLVVPQKRAIVYMDDGAYQIKGDGPASGTVNYSVVADEMHAALPF
jgi:hypothetical protein